MVTSFDRSNLRTLRTDIDNALAAVAAKHGIILSFGRVTFSSNEARGKLTLATKTQPAIIRTVPSVGTAAVSGNDPYNTLDSRAYLTCAARLGLPANGLGRTFYAGGSQFTIIGAKPSRWKMPVTAIGARGGRYKFTVDSVLKGLVK